MKNEEDLIKNEGARVLTIPHTNFSDIQGQLTPQSDSRSGQISNSLEILWLFLRLRRRIKIGTRALTTLNIKFSNTQGQVTLQSVVSFGRI